MSSTHTSTVISRSKLLDISDLNTYFTSSLFLLFGLNNGGKNGSTGNDNNAIITNEDNSISKYFLDVYQRIIRNVSTSSNTVQLLFEFITTIYLGINSNNDDDDDTAIVLSPAAHLLGFGYKTSTTITTTTSKNNVESSNSSSSNVTNKRRRRHRRRLQIIVYAFFRIVVPKLYEIMKRKGIDYIDKNNNKEEEEEEQEDVSSFLSPLTLQLSQEQQEKKEGKKEDGKVVIRTTKLLQQISLNRKKLLLQKLIQCIDTTVPIIRLLLLLSCWKQQNNQNANQYGGNVSMFLSGISYKNTMSSSSPLPIASYSSTLFVLYAHRRWFHREFIDLVWNRFGRSLITTSHDINDMVTQIYQKQKQYLLFLYKQKILKRYYKNKHKDRIIKTKANISNENENDDENETDDDNDSVQHHYCCQLCNTTNVIIPYRFIDCCQQIVCYICLWNYVIEYNTNSNNNNSNNSNNHNNHNNNNNNDKNNKNTKITIPCPICYQDIQHCQPV